MRHERAEHMTRLPIRPPARRQPRFEGYFQQLNVTRNGRIDASSAAAFLKKSQLGDPILHKARERERERERESVLTD